MNLENIQHCNYCFEHRLSLTILTKLLLWLQTFRTADKYGGCTLGILTVKIMQVWLWVSIPAFKICIYTWLKQLKLHWFVA